MALILSTQFAGSTVGMKDKRHLTITLSLFALTACSEQGQWVFDGDKDPMSDEPQAAAAVEAVSDDARLGVTCQGRGSKPMVIIEARQKLSGYEPGSNNLVRMATYRFDDGKIHATTGKIVDTMMGFEAEKGDHPILAGIRSSEKLAIEVDDLRGEKRQWVFDVTGGLNAINRVAEHCNSQ